MYSKTLVRRRNALLALSVLALILAMAIGFHPTTVGQGIVGSVVLAFMFVAGSFAAGCLSAFGDLLLPGQSKPWYVRKGAILFLLMAVPVSLVLMWLLDTKLYVLLHLPESASYIGRLLVFLCSELFLTAVTDLALADNCDESSPADPQPDCKETRAAPFEQRESRNTPGPYTRQSTGQETSQRANRLQTQNRLHR
jgi:hypothetical protein